MPVLKTRISTSLMPIDGSGHPAATALFRARFDESFHNVIVPKPGRDEEDLLVRPERFQEFALAFELIERRFRGSMPQAFAIFENGRMAFAIEA